MSWVQKFWISLPCPSCEKTSFTWVSDNADGCYYDGDTWYCDNCKATGDVVAFEDGSFELIEEDKDEDQPSTRPTNEHD